MHLSNKKAAKTPPFLFGYVTVLFVGQSCKLFLCGSANGTSVCARAAAYAVICVDNVLAVALGNSTGGASISASAASDAIIGNLVSHFEYLHLDYIYIVAHLRKKSSVF